MKLDFMYALVKKNFNEKINAGQTFILPREQEYSMTIQGIVMFPNMREYILPDNSISQDYFAKDERFRNIMVLFHQLLYG